MTTEKVVLWGTNSSRTHRPLWLAHELGIDYELRPITSRSEEIRKPEYLAVNPRHKIPAIVHGDVVITESAAILSYMAEVFPVPDGFFVPETPVERAKLLEWCYFVMTELDATAIYSIRRHGQLTDLYGDSPVAVEAGQKYFVYQLARMEEAFLKDGPFLMGERFSIADILLTSTLEIAQRYGIELPEFIKDYRRRMFGRPPYVESFRINFGREVPDV